MHGLYDEKQHEITAQQEKIDRDVVDQLKDIDEINLGSSAMTSSENEE